MLEKYYSEFGIKKYLELNSNLQDNENWFKKMITEDEIIQISRLEETEFSIKRILRIIENQRHTKEVNSFIDKTLSTGKVCSVGSGDGEKEFQLLSKSVAAMNMEKLILLIKKYLNVNPNLLTRDQNFWLQIFF